MPSTTSSLFMKRFPFILIMAIVIPPVLIWFTVIRPIISNLNVLRSKIQDQTVVLKTNEDRIQVLGKAQQILQSIKSEDQYKLNSLLADNKTTPGLISELQTMGQESGLVMGSLEITDVVPGPAEAVLPPSTHALQLAIDWRGNDTMSFWKLLGVIENNARLVDVMSVRFTTGTPSLLMNARTYYLDQSDSGSFDPRSIDTTFTSDERFQALVMRGKQIELEPRGKINPFGL